MKNYVVKLILLSKLFLFGIPGIYAQDLLPAEKKSLDSLKVLLKEESNPEKRDVVYDRLDKLYEKITTRLKYTGEFIATEKYLLQAMQVALEGKHFHVYGSLHNNMGLLLKEAGRNEEAVDYYLKALQINDKVNDPVTRGMILNNLGALYYDDKQYDKAFEYFNEAAVFRVENGDPYAGDAYWNIAFSYYQMNDTANYLINLKKASELYQKTGDIYGEGSYYFTQGEINLLKKNYITAKEYLLKTIPLYSQMNFKEFVSWTYISLARAEYGMQHITQALHYADSSIALAKQIKNYERIRVAADFLSKVYSQIADYRQALDNYKLFVAMQDSLRNEENARALINSAYKYQYTKKAAADSVAHAKEKEISDARLTATAAQLQLKRNQTYFLIAGLVLIFVFAGFIYNRFRITQQQKQIIELQKTEVEHQKDLVEEKNKEILDSITYAKRIQAAILPPAKIVRTYLNESFILYKPKDIVAGDFYWLEQLDNKILFAAADCTGHGVPGAMVSVICNNGLNRSVREFGIADPGKILDKTREIVIQEFEKSEEEMKDGMDISLCVLNEKEKTLSWAGANNPLWIFPANAQSEEDMLEVKADKQPIGKYADPKPFTTHKIKLQQGDMIYIFTDGFQDQFGGDKGKKFKAAKMKSELFRVRNLPADEQKQIIDDIFEHWKGDLEQVDDVCLIGVRI